MDVVNEVLQQQNVDAVGDKSIEVQKDIEVDIDAGQLLVSDSNSFTLKPKTNWEPTLRSLTRGNVQLLVNKIWELPAKCVEEIVVTQLPKPKYVLPRIRKVPKPKPLTKWQQFAKDKGITPKKKGKSKLKWDDMLQKWIPTFGYKRTQADKQNEWIVECKEDGKPVEDPFKAIKTSKSEKMAKNELQRLRNLAKAKKIKVPKVGLPSTEHFRDSKQLTVGAKVIFFKHLIKIYKNSSKLFLFFLINLFFRLLKYPQHH